MLDYCLFLNQNIITFAIEMTIADINTYIAELQSKIDGMETSFAHNDDGAHNAAVVITMLRNASSIYMFCGAASVFSESFYHKISKDTIQSPRYLYDEQSGMNVISGLHDSTQDIGEYLRNTMNASLVNFLSDSQRTLNIIVENKKKMVDKKFLPSVVKNCTGGFKDNVKIYSLDNSDFFRGFVDHFSYALNRDSRLFMARMENDNKSHKADCIFYPSDDMSDSLRETYSNFASVSSEL